MQYATCLKFEPPHCQCTKKKITCKLVEIHVKIKNKKNHKWLTCIFLFFQNWDFDIFSFSKTLEELFVEFKILSKLCDTYLKVANGQI